MSIQNCGRLARSHRALLCLSIAAALAPVLRDANAHGASAPGISPKNPAATHQVTNCDPSGTGSLSAVIADPTTHDNDIVDLTPLKLVCSVITLSSPLDVHQDNLFLQGPGAKYLTIDGGDQLQPIRHDGAGTLALEDLTVANGYYSGSLKPFGGCIYSKGSVALIDSVVSHCTVGATASTAALGGGIYTQGDLHLLNSEIKDGRAVSVFNADALGGGAYVRGTLTALYSTIRDSSAAVLVQGNAHAYAGAAAALGNVDIENSTISGNRSELKGALVLAGGPAAAATIIDSTVSENAGTAGAGIWTSMPTTIRNTTIVFNHSTAGTHTYGAGLHAETLGLLLVDTIVSGNSAGGVATDLGGVDMSPSSHNDLVVASTLTLPVDTIRNCPKLDVLADNGGQTLTNGLDVSSGAVDHGSSTSGITIDQRLAPRMTGAAVDIGAVERQPGDVRERLLASGFDGLCDQ